MTRCLAISRNRKGLSSILWRLLLGASLVCNVAPAWGHDDKVPGAPRVGVGTVTIQSQPGPNPWNAGQPPENWWEEIKRQHGHVGPWNVLGWRIGQAALREFKSEWGRHELQVVCYVPLQTPFTCMVDGLSVGTGNSLGRLDLRLGEVLHFRQTFVAVCRKDKTGPVLEFRPKPDYLRTIVNRPVEELERLSKECGLSSEDKLFSIHRLH